MEFELNIKMNDKLYLRDPQSSALGKSIIRESVTLIDRIGFEEFTFKKLAIEIETTEASVYRYFENKHKLLVYLLAWYWSYMQYKITISLQNIKTPEEKIKVIINLLVSPEAFNVGNQFLNETKLHQIIVSEGSKSFLTKHVAEENKDKLFKPYKDICALISNIIIEYDNTYKFPKSLAATLLEAAHTQKFYSANLPSLSSTKLGEDKKLIEYLESFVFAPLKKTKSK